MRTFTIWTLLLCAPLLWTSDVSGQKPDHNASDYPAESAEVQSATSALAQTFEQVAESGPSNVAAVQDDAIWVVLNHVDADQREQFERFTYRRLIPAILQAAVEDPLTARANRLIRVLEPVEANDDGTWTYVYMMDPAMAKVNYDFTDLLGDIYSQDDAGRYAEEFYAALSRPQERYVLRASHNDR